MTYDLSDALDALFDAFNDARSDNWDGEQARAVTPGALDMAAWFLLALPIGTPFPEVDASPSGGILLSWRSAPRLRLSMTLTETGVISYAALLGRDRQKGTALFADVAPPSLMHLIRRVSAAS